MVECTSYARRAYSHNAHSDFFDGLALLRAARLNFRAPDALEI